MVGLPVFLSHERSASLALMHDPLLLNPWARWEEHRAARRHATAPARWAAGAGFLLLLAAAVRRVPDWGAAVLGIGAMPLLFSLASSYYCAFVVFAALSALAGAPAVWLAALTWATTAIPGVFPGRTNATSTSRWPCSSS